MGEATEAPRRVSYDKGRLSAGVCARELPPRSRHLYSAVATTVTEIPRLNGGTETMFARIPLTNSGDILCPPQAALRRCHRRGRSLPPTSPPTTPRPPSLCLPPRPPPSPLYPATVDAKLAAIPPHPYKAPSRPPPLRPLPPSPAVTCPCSPRVPPAPAQPSRRHSLFTHHLCRRCHRCHHRGAGPVSSAAATRQPAAASCSNRHPSCAAPAAPSAFMAALRGVSPHRPAPNVAAAPRTERSLRRRLGCVHKRAFSILTYRPGN